MAQGAELKMGWARNGATGHPSGIITAKKSLDAEAKKKLAASWFNTHSGSNACATAIQVAKKDWDGVSLGKAVGITMQTILRHSLTDYDQLLLVGVDREEARRRVQPKINPMIATWKKRRS